MRRVMDENPTYPYPSLYTDATDLAAALHTIANQSTDPDSVRISMAALMGTEVGRRYVSANPIGY